MKPKVREFIDKTIRFLTPVKGAALILVVLGVLDHLTYLDFSGEESFWTEALVRSFFIFCGIFGLIGNGKTARLRTFIVSIPYLYLSIFYIVSGMAINSDTITVLSVPPGLFAMWLNIAGSYYE